VSWSTDKDFGEQAVVAVWKWFSTMGLFAQVATGNWRQWDFALRGYIEVKHDARAEETGRLFVETHARGIPSGISTSKATTWVFVIGRRAFILSADVLKEIATRLPETTTRDGKTGRLLALDRLSDIAHVEVNLGRLLE
jgi:hypothetical protein